MDTGRQIQSDVISWMRFPLIVLVVYIHVLPPICREVELSLSGENLYVFFSEWLSHSIGRIAVPAFFVFSGYFFFHRMKEWGAKFYKTQLLKRFYSLFLPYLIWNFLAVFIVSLKFYVFEKFGIAQSETSSPLQNPDFAHIFWLGPANYPLWYMRDLLCMVVISPLFYLLFRYLKIYGLLLIYLLYILNIELGVIGLSSTAIFYFGLGAYLGLFKMNLLEKSLQLRYIAMPLTLILPVVATLIYGKSEMYEYIIRFFIPFGLVTLMSMIYRCRDNNSISSFLKNSERFVFFIYVAHSFLIIGWVKGFFARLSFIKANALGDFVSYLLIPMVTILLCVIIYIVWHLVSPKSLSFVLGGRATR